jgi:hypothetical protein
MLGEYKDYVALRNRGNGLRRKEVTTCSHCYTNILLI